MVSIPRRVSQTPKKLVQVSLKVSLLDSMLVKLATFKVIDTTCMSYKAGND